MSPRAALIEHGWIGCTPFFHEKNGKIYRAFHTEKMEFDMFDEAPICSNPSKVKKPAWFLSLTISLKIFIDNFYPYFEFKSSCSCGWGVDFNKTPFIGHRGNEAKRSKLVELHEKSIFLFAFCNFETLRSRDFVQVF